MDFKIKSKYLVFPVNVIAGKKKLYFKTNDKELYSLNIRLDNISPDFFAYIDVSRFYGKTLNISVEPQMELNFREADEMKIKNLYNEPMRPQAHFTTKNGWINDPNGLVYLNGVYHMFYQYNPTEPNWENMHWGHAVSNDMIHWEEKDIALFPDERGTMYSGSAVIDEKNLLGLNNGDNKAALLFYTATSPYCQHLSYSLDEFKTIQRFSEKPIIPHILAGNRDPKVVFCEELDCYIMALYLDEDVYALLKSNNLSDWEEFQRIHLYGDNECPDIFMLYDEIGARKWIIMGAHDKYLVGGFESGKFVAEQSVQSLHYGSSGYAGQTFSNLPNNRVVRMVWDRCNLSAVAFKGQMGIPMEISLAKFDDKYYLEANPIKEIEKIYRETKLYNTVSVSPESDFKVALDKTPHLLKFKIQKNANGKLSVYVFGVSIDFDFDTNEMKIGGDKAPIAITDNEFDITVVLDRISAEIFSDGGKVFLSKCNIETVNDYNLPYIRISSTKTAVLDSLEINPLNSIWNN